MKKIWLALVLPVLVFTMAGCGSQKQTAEVKDMASEKITVSAAASLQDALNEIKANFVKEHALQADQIRINYGGSGTLRQQIEQGAPSSIFISASERHMKALEEKKMMSQVKPYVTNSLVLIVPAGKKEYTFDTIKDVHHLSIGTPESVPAGKYAQETLQYLKLWEPLQGKIVFAKDVRAVLAQVSQGAVDAGLVYKTDAMSAKNAVKITAVAPADSHKTILYPAGLVTINSNELAKAFYAYLFTPKSQDILKKYGFTPSK